MITGIVPICHYSTLVLFDLSFSYSCVMTYFARDINIVCEPFVVHISVSTLVDESLVANQIN